MNLFIKTMADYIKEEWTRVLSSSDATKEVRLLTESLDPESALVLLESLEQYRASLATEGKNIKCYFRVATDLWSAWQSNSAEYLNVQAKLESNQYNWIDKDNKLTWYRNRTLEAGYDALVIVLVGFNHASDQGGLADFHLVDEAKLWNYKLKRGFSLWIKELDNELSLALTETQEEQIDSVILELIRVKPRRLSKLAEYLQDHVIVDKNFYQAEAVLEAFYAKLPFWDLPPIFTKNISSSKMTGAIKIAGEFISHQFLKTSAEQKKTWQKIEKAIAAAEEKQIDGFVVPETLAEIDAYVDKQDYINTLRQYVFEADSLAKQRLLHTDFAWLFGVLKKPAEKEKTDPKETVRKLSGLSIDIVLEAIWLSLSGFYKHVKPHEVKINNVRIEVELFAHDIESDADEGLDGNDLARGLLQGCLGGLDAALSNMPLSCPIDEDQAKLAMDDWGHQISINFEFDASTVRLQTHRQKPYVQFRVVLIPDDVDLLDEDKLKTLEAAYIWMFDSHHPERVRYLCAKEVWSQWIKLPATKQPFLPAFQLPNTQMTALYYAADEDEANRLALLVLGSINLTNLVGDIEAQLANIDSDLLDKLRHLTAHYKDWLSCYCKEGYYTATHDALLIIIADYTNLVDALLSKGNHKELLSRLYKAFLVFDSASQANQDYLPAAIAWGVTPAVLDLTHARFGFLRNGFPEVIGLLMLGKSSLAEAAFFRLLNLVEIRRPLAGLIVDSKKSISVATKAYGFIHWFGEKPSTAKSLAVQMLLREEESDDDVNVSDFFKPNKDSEIVQRVLADYVKLHPFAHDGIRILAVNVGNLSTVLSGVNLFLKSFLEKGSKEWPAFHLEIKLYTTSASPLAMENRIVLWRDEMVERFRDEGRQLQLAIGHRFAQTPEDMKHLISKEPRLFDVAFLFDFLMKEQHGEVHHASPFEYNFNPSNINKFPICEYPLPTQHNEIHKRRVLLSNRKLRIQALHTKLTAKLRHPDSVHSDYVAIGVVEYSINWQGVIAELHSKSQWVACVDPFVDKRLISAVDHNRDLSERKIVGFASGLGAYGELNLSISSEQDTLRSLIDLVEVSLSSLFPQINPKHFAVISPRIVQESEEIIGLSSLRAVVGDGEKVREVIGFSAIRRLLQDASDGAIMRQLMPMDALLHWFQGSEHQLRPDLVQLSIILRKGLPPLIKAVVMECKVGIESLSHSYKASQQVIDGLSHLVRIFEPNHRLSSNLVFDQRYWWAQLQRAITSRSELLTRTDCTDDEIQLALERIAEGYYDIEWRGALFTFWTNETGQDVKVTPLAFPLGVFPSYISCDNFAIEQIEFGADRLLALFEGDNSVAKQITLTQKAIHIRCTTDESMPLKGVVTFNESPSIVENDNTQGTIVNTEELPKADQPQPQPVEVVNVNTPLTVVSQPIIQATLVPEKILIGTRGSKAEPVYWYYGHSKLTNRHLLLFGSSGSGKTYGIQCLLAELAAQSLNSVIIDYTDGFLPQQVESRFKEIGLLKNHVARIDKLPLNPFKRQTKIIDPDMPPLEDDAYEVASRVASTFKSVYQIGDQQFSALLKAIEEGVAISPSFNLDNLLADLYAQETQYSSSVASKLEPFIKSKPFKALDSDAWAEMLTSKQNHVHVLQLAGVAREIQKLITEFVLWDLYAFACSNGSKDKPIPIVLDEIQNLDHGSDSPIDKMLREGRKFGLSLILATQTTSNFNQEQRDRLFQASHKLFFKPANTEVSAFADILSKATQTPKKEWEQRLTNLQKGQCWSLGQVMTSSGQLKEEAVLVNVTSLESRFLSKKD